MWHRASRSFYTLGAVFALVSFAVLGFAGTASASISSYTYSGSGTSYDFTAQSNSGRQAIGFSTDGTSMYLTDSFSGSKIYQYTLGTAWNPSTATYIRSETASTTGLTGIYFSTDGTKMYTQDFYGATLRQYTLSTAWNIATAGASGSKALTSGNHYSMAFDPDGSKFYTFNSYTAKVEEYTLGTPWDISTISASVAKQVSVSGFYYMNGGTFSSDGSTLYILANTVSSNAATIYQYNLSTPWDVSSATYSSSSLSVTSQDPDMYGLAINGSTSNLYGAGYTSGDRKVFEYLSNAVDITPPSVSLTAPTSSEATSSTMTLAATASDNVGVAGVAFFVDGVQQGSTTTAPYAVTYNTTATSSGSHTAFAVAHDAAGNYATSTTVTFTTDNTHPVLTAAAQGTNDTWIRLSWNSDKSTSSLVNFGLASTYGSSTPEIDTSPRVTGHVVDIHNLVACTLYHYQLQGADSLGNVGTSTDATFITTGCASGNSVVESHQDASVTVSSGASSTLTQGTASLGVTMPSNVASTTSSFTLQIKALDGIGTLGSPSSSLNLIASTTYDVKALINASTTLDSFDVPVTITAQYDSSTISSIDTSTLQMYHYHGGAWLPLDSCSINTSAKTVTCTTPSFSTFALFGKTQAVSSGASTSSGGSSNGGSIQNQVRNLLSFGNSSEAQKLMQQWPNLFTPSVASVGTMTASSTMINNVRDLKLGSRGSDVQKLQQLLIAQNSGLAAKELIKVGATGYFGVYTKNALSAYQRSHDISPSSGYFGSITRSQMKSSGLPVVWW